jgi:acyl-CoA thioesterase
MTDDRETDAQEAAIRSGKALFEALGGFHPTGWDASKKELTAAFTVRREFCHTNATIAQGGFVTAWLDAAMAHAVMADSDYALTVASLDINVSFLARVGPGPGTVVGRIVRLGNRIAFMQGDLYNAEGVHAAAATSTGLVIPYSKPGA